MSRTTIVIAFVAAGIAWIGATDRPGGWNDGSRLATVESLVDHGTWAIDDSTFCTSTPYDPGAVPNGTLDKLFIRGHYYSDKSPVPALLMAGPYWIWRSINGAAVADNPRSVCFFLTLMSSGIAYVLSVVAMSLIARRYLPPGWYLLATASFALATIALPYARVVNNHVFLLAVSSVILLLIDSLAETRRRWILTALLGSAAGLAYTIDLGAGPLTALGTGLLYVWRVRSFWHVVVFGLCALPWVALHHGITYAIAGTFGPANANPEFFRWPGCPFDTTNLTGSWRHRHLSDFALYAVDLLIGKRGFLGHDAALFLMIPATVVLLRQQGERRKPEITLCAAWCTAVWLLYSATSNNYSGECCSIRWFVPLLAPGYYVLIQYLKWVQPARAVFVTLSAISGLITIYSWWRGPWTGRMVPGYWALMGVAAFSWCAIEWHRERTSRPQAPRLRSAA